MSSYEESYQRSCTDQRDRATVDEFFRAEYPALAVVFGGKPGDGNGGPGVSPATINLWFEGGEMHFCIMPRFGNRVAFGVLADCSKGLSALEEAIAEGRFGWKISKSRKSA
jgi:hypothetical protein